MLVCFVYVSDRESVFCGGEKLKFSTHRVNVYVLNQNNYKYNFSG